MKKIINYFAITLVIIGMLSFVLLLIIKPPFVSAWIVWWASTTLIIITGVLTLIANQSNHTRK